METCDLILMKNKARKSIVIYFYPTRLVPLSWLHLHTTRGSKQQRNNNISNPILPQNLMRTSWFSSTFGSGRKPGINSSLLVTFILQGWYLQLGFISAPQEGATSKETITSLTLFYQETCWELRDLVSPLVLLGNPAKKTIDRFQNQHHFILALQEWPQMEEDNETRQFPVWIYWKTWWKVPRFALSLHHKS